MVRDNQADVSQKLAAKWQQLNFLVLLSCILAIVFAILLKLLRKSYITQQKTKAALLDNERKFRTLLENISELITVVNANGKIVYISKNAADFTGYSDFEKMGSSIFDNIYPMDLEIARQAFNDMLNSARPVNATYRVVHRNDTIFWFEARGNHFKDVDGERRVLIIGRDISKRKKLEDQLLQARKIEALGTLAGGIAHDFNNILASIMGYTELAQDDLPGNSIAQERLSHIHKASLRGKSLVNQILTFRREKKTEKKTVHIETAVKEAIKLLQASAPPSVKVMEHIHPNCGFILANATQIHQVVMNLGTNALHAMHNSGGVLDIILMPIKIDMYKNKVDADLEEGDYIQLTVRDTGHGMDTATIGRIFDPFFTTKSVKKGTGLGLSVVHAIIENHDGAILVDSEPGIGTTFNIYLPRVAGKPEPTILDVEKLPKTNNHILFVDDEEMLLQTGKQMLERLGYKVTTTPSSRDALEKFRENPDYFDLVITDQVMPQMLGVELAKALLQIRADIPVILMTGYSETITMEKAEEIGIAEMFLKPTSSRQLDETIRRILSNEVNKEMQT